MRDVDSEFRYTSLLQAPYYFDRTSEDRAHVRDSCMRLLSEVVGETVDQVLLRAGDDLTRKSGNSSMVSGLRYCVSCLQSGYHATLFQHLSLYECPEHSEPLRMGCVKCRAPIQPSIATTLRDPFGCLNCGHLLARSVAVHFAPEHLLGLETRLSTLRRGLSGAYLRHVDPRIRNLSASAAHCRQTRRFTLWEPKKRDGTTSNRLHEVIPFLGSEIGSRGIGADDYGPGVVDEALKWLSDQCGCEDVDFVGLISRLSAVDAGLRLEGRARTIVAALCKTAMIFGRMRWLTTRFGLPPMADDRRWESHRLSDNGWLSSRVDKRLIRLEVISLFAVVLSQMRRLHRLDEVAWHERPASCTFLTAAVRLEVAGLYFARIRPRANERSVQRLMRRIRDSHLERPSEDAHPQCRPFDEAIARARA